MCFQLKVFFNKYANNKFYRNRRRKILFYMITKLDAFFNVTLKLPGRLLTYPPSSRRWPSTGSHMGGI